MVTSLAIGDFSRASHMSVKTLRHYHRIGLLEPADVDPATGYRRYSTEQIPTAQVIRRFRALDMPLDDIRAVLTAPDLGTRNELIEAHLGRLEGALARTQGAVSSLRDLLRPPAPPASVGRRQVEPTPVAAIREVVSIEEAMTWLRGALGELHATTAARGLVETGPAGGIFANRLFEDGIGEATLFIPIAGPVRATGRVTNLVVPAAELATTVHAGPLSEIDRAYGLLAAYVTQHALAVDGPIREYYLVGPHQTAEQTAWRTEVGWPIFDTGPPE
jgi:DNA-binding transcriptional MerR regulator